MSTPQITPKQPDRVVAGANLPGAGGPYRFQANVAHQVSTCRDASNQVVPLDACLRAAAYSSFFTFTANRVIVK